MKNVDRILTALTCGFVLFGAASALADSDHPVITMNAPYRNLSEFVDKVHEAYPEINLEIMPYNGQNMTNWVIDMRQSGEMPDIYFSTIYVPGRYDDEADFLNLSSYTFTDNYIQSRLREVTLNGGIYMLPLAYNALGITYNQTIFEENGWEVPNSFKELEQLKPKAEAAGYTFSINQLQYPGYGFQYLCNIADTDFLSTIDGMDWQEQFINGEANVSDTPEMVAAIRLLDRWRDLGMLNANGTPDNDAKTKRTMLEGNTLFLVGNSNDLNVQGETSSTFRLMPYLSQDGDQNVFVLNVSRYVGLNKHLADAGNEQKLEDVLHVMEVLTTVEGMESLEPTQNNSRLLPLKDFTFSEESYYTPVVEELNSGHTASFIYSGWENVIVPLGEKMIEFVEGNCTTDDVIASFDENQYLITENVVPYYTVATETLNTDDCARLVGICFAQAVDADAALISENQWYYNPDVYELNKNGVSGCLFAMNVGEQEIVSILPTGWSGAIQTVTLTGARIKELAAEGYDFHGNGDTYPYAFVTRPNLALEDDKVYKVAICGATDAVMEEGNIQDSGVIGLDVMREYLSQFETLSKEDIIWE